MLSVSYDDVLLISCTEMGVSSLNTGKKMPLVHNTKFPLLAIKIDIIITSALAYSRIVDYALKNRRRRFLSSAMLAQRDRRWLLQIMRDKNCFLPGVHIIFSLTDVQKLRFFKYAKRAGHATFRVYLKNIVLKRRDD